MKINHFYDNDGKLWQVWWSDQEYYAKQITPSLSIYYSIDTDKIVGFSIGI